LRNYGDVAAPLGQRVVTTNLRRAVYMSPNLPARDLQPGEALRLSLAALGLAPSPYGELGLMTAGRADGMVDFLFFGPVADTEIHRRVGPDNEWEIVRE
jgi:hypothetical protein